MWPELTWKRGIQWHPMFVRWNLETTTLLYHPYWHYVPFHFVSLERHEGLLCTLCCRLCQKKHFGCMKMVNLNLPIYWNKKGKQTTYRAHENALSRASKLPSMKGAGGLGSKAIHQPTGILTVFIPFLYRKSKSSMVMNVFLCFWNDHFM